MVGLGARIREIRKERRWSQAELAQKAGMAQTSISEIEREQISPSVDTVERIAAALGISVGVLFESPLSGVPAA